MKKFFFAAFLVFIWILISCSNQNQFDIQINPIDYFINYEESMQEALIGDGKNNFLVQSGSLKHKSSEKDFLPYEIQIDDISFDLSAKKGSSTFFPGGVIYRFEKNNIHFEIMHACLKTDPYVCFIKVENSKGKISSPESIILNSIIEKTEGYQIFKFASNTNSLSYTWKELQFQSMYPYIQEGMLLKSPSNKINKAVAYNQFLLDLGYNDELIVCELFRYRDIWSRDLGSGFGPGALFTNRIEAAKNCIHYDMNRYVKSTAQALKTTNDASKGGSAEGTAWLSSTLWDYYLITGDRDFLEEGANDIRPFVEAWIDRDYNNDGLIIDVTEWMDHSRHYLLPFGSATTYSNALMVHLLSTFSKIEKELGNENDSKRYSGLVNRFSEGINKQLWSEEINAYVNLQVNGVQDRRIASAANALAILAGVSNPEKTAQIFTTLENNNWKKDGSMTITPRTTHVDSDQNEKIWPWWNATEALARFKNKDSKGGVRLLENCATTIEIDRFPGLMEEILDKHGETEGGNTFVTGAGSFLNSAYKGLLGIEIIEAGMHRIRIQPNLPKEWENLKAKIPTPNGYFSINLENEKLKIGVFDSTIKEVEVENGVLVVGAKSLPISHSEKQEIFVEEEFIVPEINHKKAAVFFEKGIPFKNRKLPFPKIGLKELCNIENSKYQAIIFTTNAMPAMCSNGDDFTNVLERFIEKGGSIIFYGAKMETLDGYYAIKMGLQGGIIEWYKKEMNQWLPFNKKTNKIADNTIRGGTVYWGEGPYFNSWDVQKGMFGFSANGVGMFSEFKNLNNPNLHIKEVFTDFAVSKPYYFQSLADTKTDFNFMHPQEGELLSCFCRIVNTETKGEFILISESIAEQIKPKEITSVLKLK